MSFDTAHCTINVDCKSDETGIVFNEIYGLEGYWLESCPKLFHIDIVIWRTIGEKYHGFGCVLESGSKAYQQDYSTNGLSWMIFAGTNTVSEDSDLRNEIRCDDIKQQNLGILIFLKKWVVRGASDNSKLNSRNPTSICKVENKFLKKIGQFYSYTITAASVSS